MALFAAHNPIFSMICCLVFILCHKHFRLVQNNKSCKLKQTQEISISQCQWRFCGNFRVSVPLAIAASPTINILSGLETGFPPRLTDPHSRRQQIRTNCTSCRRVTLLPRTTFLRMSGALRLCSLTILTLVVSDQAQDTLEYNSLSSCIRLTISFISPVSREECLFTAMIMSNFKSRIIANRGLGSYLKK